jgi:enoyl-CoA hydratase/carnithine racemase
MSHPAITVERVDRVVCVRFDRQGRANAIDFATMDALSEIARGFDGDTETAAIVLAGAPKIFSGGMDLLDPAFEKLDDMSFGEIRALAERGPRMVRAWGDIEIPTIAAIEGPCIGGGVVLAAICDFRVAGSGARFGAPEVAVGLNMGWHSVPLLTGLVGAQATRRLLMLGDEWGADDARQLGFVDRVVDDGDALEAALEMAATLQARPGQATRMAKRQIDAAVRSRGFASSALDKDQHALAWMSDDFRKALETFRAT